LDAPKIVHGFPYIPKGWKFELRVATAWLRVALVNYIEKGVEASDQSKSAMIRARKARREESAVAMDLRAQQSEESMGCL
jgi:hypothetical protein